MFYAKKGQRRYSAYSTYCVCTYCGVWSICGGRLSVSIDIHTQGHGWKALRLFSMPSLHAYESLPVSDEPSAKISLLLTHLIERLAYGVNTASQYMCQ